MTKLNYSINIFSKNTGKKILSPKKLNSDQYAAVPLQPTLYLLPVSLLDHHVWVDILQAQPASGTGLAEKLHFVFGASGSTAAEVQLQHFCRKI